MEEVFVLAAAQSQDTVIGKGGKGARNVPACASAALEMKLLIYAHDWAPTLGGIQTITQILAAGVAARIDSPVEVTLVTMTAAACPSQSPLNFPSDSDLNYRVFRRPSFPHLFRLIREADVIHIAGPCISPLALSILLRKPVVVEHHGFQAVCPNGQLLYQPSCSPCPGYFMAGNHLACLRCNSRDGWVLSLRLWLLTFLRRGLCRLAGANVVPTKYLGGILRLPRAREIVHGLPQFPASSAPAMSAGDIARPAVLLFVGRLVSSKGAELLLRAAKQLRERNLDFRITFAGDGPERAALQVLARDFHLNSRVDFCGSLSDQDLNQALRECNALVAPSIAGEVFGLVVVQAMMRGKPVIVPVPSALAEVAGDAAFTFPIADDAALAACMRRCIENPGEAAARGQSGRARALAEYAAENMVAEHLKLYRQLAGNAQ